MAPFKKNVAQPKQVSLDSPPNTELPKVELPEDENKLFDENDELGASTLPDLLIASEKETTPLKNV